MALHTDMQLLIKTIRQPILFFLPRGIFEEAIKKDLSDLEDVGLLNTLFIIDSQGGIKPLVHITELLPIMDKVKILKSSVFELLDLKTKLDKSAFHYLIDDYFKELSTWIRTTDIIRNEAKNHATNYKPEVQSYLTLQHKVLKDHHEELKKHFGKWKSQFEIKRLLNLNFEGNKTSLNAIKTDDLTGVKSDKDKPVPSKKIKPKNIPISEVDADHYLLKRVFNVDFTKISNAQTS